MKYLVVVVCAYILCQCAYAVKNEYAVTETIPLSSGSEANPLFDPRDEIFQLQQHTPKKYLDELAQRLGNQDTSKGFQTAYIQEVREYPSSKPLKMAVELTRIIIDVPYYEFIQKIPPEAWGAHLSGYLGGEVLVLKRDGQSRATHQIERMVLRAPIRNLDMTKSEVIVYDSDRATVYWRVFHSDNGTTRSDIGCVEFAGIDSKSTMVTFQSAHRLYVPNFLVKWSLASTFMRHLENYKKIASK
jgi:hypothetical protein